MTPTVEHALAKFRNAPKERQEKLAQIMLVELEDVQEGYDQFVNRVLDSRAEEIKAGQTIPAKKFIADLQADMRKKYG